MFEIDFFYLKANLVFFLGVSISIFFLTFPDIEYNLRRNFSYNVRIGGRFRSYRKLYIEKKEKIQDSRKQIFEDIRYGNDGQRGPRSGWLWVFKIFLSAIPIHFTLGTVVFSLTLFCFIYYDRCRRRSSSRTRYYSYNFSHPA